MQERTVSVGKETVAVRKSMVVDASPIPADKGAYKQDKRAFRLMEIGYQQVHQTELEARNYNYAGPDAQLLP